MKRLKLITLLVWMAIAVSAQVSLTRVSVHDPSVVWDPTQQRYYIFGSHRASAYSTNMMNWRSFTAQWKTQTTNYASNKAAFVTNQTTKITVNGVERQFGNFDALAWSSAYGGDYNIDGNMWAPDVIYNPTMQKWCMYLSINGPQWNSSIILLTADQVNGPYMYQGPVVYSGFNVNNIDAVNYKKTDLEIAIGEQASLPARYNRGKSWGDYWPHCIDPCVFYDEEGKLWMSYGSWSGGIWMLRLNEQNGLRDYDITYSISGTGKTVTSDPYFGKKIGGGCYVSGEASYIEHIGNHYFLFITNGGLEQTGGYQMRVFRSENPDGPYVDVRGRNAIYNSYTMNYGPSSDTRGVNIFGAYGSWGKMKDGERSQGHNSILAAEDGRTYLVYHTRFQNGGEGHQVRVHQVFQNEDGWLVAAPFEYTGEEVTSADIATTQQIATALIPGNYQILFHKYGLNHKNKELVEPVEIQLNADGSITGYYKGRWEITEGTCYIRIVLNSIEYKGVMVMQTMEPSSEQAVTFSVLTTNGVTVWGRQTEAADPTGIQVVERGKISAPTGTFDLQGRRVTTPKQKGIYIIDGKKQVIR